MSYKIDVRYNTKIYKRSITCICEGDKGDHKTIKVKHLNIILTFDFDSNIILLINGPLYH